MSEKMMIDFETFCKNCSDYIGEDRKCMRVWSPRTYDECSKECPEWLALSRPTLADVCGTRTLDSMTEKEIKELVELYAGSSIYIKLVLRDNDKSIYVEYVECAKRRTLHIYLGELSVGGKEVKIFKWFIKNGFNVLGDI